MSAFRQKCHSQRLIIPDKFKEFKTMSDDVEEPPEFFYGRFPLSQKKTPNSHSRILLRGRKYNPAEEHVAMQNCRHVNYIIPDREHTHVCFIYWVSYKCNATPHSESSVVQLLRGTARQ
jgi:hypothetical protein